MKMRG
ncbi:unnamed protein product [Linum tenue]